MENKNISDEQRRDRQIEHERDLQLIQGLRLMDDEFMSMVFDQNIKGVQLLVNTSRANGSYRDVG